MAVSPAFCDFVREQLEDFGPVEIKRMFGGAGLFRDGLMFALITSEDRLYFKVDDKNRARFEAEDLPAFTYSTAKGDRGIMSYMAAPERCLEDRDEMTDWARQAFRAALSADAGKKKPKRKR